MRGRVAACVAVAEGKARLVTGDAVEVEVGLIAFRLMVPFEPLLNGDADCLFDIHSSLPFHPATPASGWGSRTARVPSDGRAIRELSRRGLVRRQEC
jgi:hypothetical protein